MTERHYPPVTRVRYDVTLYTRCSMYGTPYAVSLATDDNGRRHTVLTDGRVFDLDHVSHLEGLDVKVTPTEKGLQMKPLSHQSDHTVEELMAPVIGELIAYTRRSRWRTAYLQRAGPSFLLVLATRGIMIIMVKITEVIKQFKRFGKGPGVLMRGEIDEEAKFPFMNSSRHFLLIGQHLLIGQEVSFLVGNGQRMRAEILPFDNQPGQCWLSDQHPGSPRQRGRKPRIGKTADAHSEAVQCLAPSASTRSCRARAVARA